MTRLDDWHAKRSPHGDVDVARRMLEKWPKGTPPLKPAALATRLGELRRGRNDQWWRNRRGLLTLAADVLDADVEDLIDRSRLDPECISFAEFSRLPPLAPGQELCRVSRSGWLLHEALAALDRLDGDAGGVVWIVAPPGAGKSLCVRLLNDRHSAGIVGARVRTLEAAAAFGETDALLIEVEEAQSGVDARALEWLRGRLGPVVVLAAFEPPAAHTDPGDSWFARSSPSVIRYTLRRDWRLRMVRWVDQRLDGSDRETRFDAARVTEWLKRHDPLQRLVATPGALLALCAVFDLHSGDEVGVSGLARRWLEMAPGPAALGAPVAESLGTSTTAYESLAVGHFLRTDERHGHLTEAQWAHLLPHEVSPGSDGTLGPVNVIAGARQAGWLRGDVQGLTLYPSWVSEGLIRDALAEQFDDPDVAWGRLAADASRQALVDAALDGLPDGGLRRLARIAAARAAPSSLASVAGVEALARRVAIANSRSTVNWQRTLADSCYFSSTCWSLSQRSTRMDP